MHVGKVPRLTGLNFLYSTLRNNRVQEKTKRKLKTDSDDSHLGVEHLRNYVVTLSMGLEKLLVMLVGSRDLPLRTAVSEQWLNY